MHRLWNMGIPQWGIGGGFIASICCVGPPLAILLGLSGASFLVGATSYSPFFYAISGILMVGGLVLARRRQKSLCSIEESRRSRWLFPLVLTGTAGAVYLVLTQAVSPLLAPVAGQHIAGLAAEVSATAVERGPSLAQLPKMVGVRRAELSISGMT